MKIALAPLLPLEVEVPGIGTYLVPAPTRAQIDRAIAYQAETEKGEFSLVALDRRRREELFALIEPAPAPWLAWLPPWLLRLCRKGSAILPVYSLHPAQVQEVLTALVNHYFGHDAPTAVALERAKKKALMTTAASLLSSAATRAPSASPSASAPVPSAS